MAGEKKSKADAAYDHAVAVCNRLTRELEEQLPPNYEPRRKDHDDDGRSGQDGLPDADAG